MLEHRQSKENYMYISHFMHKEEITAQLKLEDVLGSTQGDTTLLDQQVCPYISTMLIYQISALSHPKLVKLKFI